MNIPNLSPVAAAATYRMNPALRDFWITPARYKILHGGRASSKSHDAAGMAVYLARNYQVKFMCARQFQNRLDESVFTLVKAKIEEARALNEFTFTKHSILHRRTGSEFLFYGIARNLQEIKSTEGVDILWLEEAHYLTEEQWNVIEPTIRAEGSEIWIIFNPDEVTDFVYQRFVLRPPENTLVRQINWQENPFLSQTMLDVIAAAYKEDKKKATHIYGGVPKTGSDKSVINLQFILAAIDAHKKIDARRGWTHTGQRVIGFDVADDGEDKNAIVHNHGNILVGVEEWDGLEDELLKSSTKVYSAAKEWGASVTYDSIGIGAHVGSKFSELNDAQRGAYRLSYDAFNAGGRVLDPDGIYMKLPHVNITNGEYFSNIKAQMWWAVADRFRKTFEAIEHGKEYPLDEMVSLDSSAMDRRLLDRLCIELSSPRKDIDGFGKVKVESKKDMLEKRGVKSPNMADAAIMSLIKPKRDAAGFFDL